MPAIVGAIKLIAVASSGIFNVGDVYSMAPISYAKTYAGGGSFNTGDGIQVQLRNSNTNVNDSDAIDQPITRG